VITVKSEPLSKEGGVKEKRKRKDEITKDNVFQAVEKCSETLR
jgi:hypothetical protein